MKKAPGPGRFFPIFLAAAKACTPHCAFQKGCLAGLCNSAHRYTNIA
ncbi:hypothetical protein HMPREF3213_01788 [Heyndrickxia coagulans]|uniref:Uncharacterized protein n=1 Tax=Heyndrickxia coagulans TaxID=1398 RepID=A0A133KSV4_HEYCO|nr:hypothetical protein HMPREF3213_01788 [Heyndrickxia coagulans]